MTSKTPADVLEAIKKLDASDQVTIQTYLAKLKSTVRDLEEQLTAARRGNVDHHDDDDDDGHAHYHGGERCTGHHDHGHEHHDDPAASSHEHEHSHETERDDDDSRHDGLPAWKQEAMNADPAACPFGGTWETESSLDAAAAEHPPMYSGDGSHDDHDLAALAKAEASDLRSQGNYLEALDAFTRAVLAAEPSALLLANRAHVLFCLGRYAAAVRDCDAALDKNPDSAKALRIRGECRAKMGEYHAALKDLSAAQTIDFDEDAAIMLKEAAERCREMDAEVVKKRVEEEERLKKRAAEVSVVLPTFASFYGTSGDMSFVVRRQIKKAQQDAKKEAAEEKEKARARNAAASPGGMPGMAGMQGMMAGLMSDPEIAAGMQNPKIQKAFTDLMSGPGGPMGLMSNPAKLQELMADPEVGPFLQKFMGKIMGGVGGGMGMPGGMGAASTGGAGFGEDMPDLRGDDDLDDMPDLVD
ncbi:hypothetical protein ACHAW6_001825 [Cyclotella cf. meneghiniana]